MLSWMRDEAAHSDCLPGVELDQKLTKRRMQFISVKYKNLDGYSDLNLQSMAGIGHVTVQKPIVNEDKLMKTMSAQQTQQGMLNGEVFAIQTQQTEWRVLELKSVVPSLTLLMLCRALRAKTALNPL